jgi:hypothetical protein
MRREEVKEKEGRGAARRQQKSVEKATPGGSFGIKDRPKRPDGASRDGPADGGGADGWAAREGEAGLNRAPPERAVIRKSAETQSVASDFRLLRRPRTAGWTGIDGRADLIRMLGPGDTYVNPIFVPFAVGLNGLDPRNARGHFG